MKKLLIIILFFSCTSYANNEVQVFFNYIRNGNFSDSKSEIKNVTDIELKKQLKDYYNLIYLGKTPKNKIITSKNNLGYTIETISLLNSGLKLYYKDGNEVEAFKILKKSLNIAIANNNKVLICETSKAILEMYERFSNTLYDKSYSYFLNIHKENAYDDLEIKYNKYYEFSINLRYNYDDTKLIIDLHSYFKGTIKGSDPYFLKVKYFIAICGYHYKITQNYNLGINNINNAKEILNNKNGYLDNEKKQSINILQGVLYYLLEKPKIALRTLKETKKYENLDFIFKIQEKYKYYWLYIISSKFSKSAIDSLRFKNKFLELDILINHDKSLRSVSELETKYQTEKKEKENLQLKTDKEKTRNFLIGSIIFIILGGTIGFLSLKNSKRKRKLAEQQKQLETQKNLTLLKEQEITTINAMVEGQEKERKRVAEDLHDNLGSVLATLKLHFENLKINKEKKKIDQEVLFNKTENLIDEAYLKVRKIAHAENSGVIANQGLLSAVKIMADKISSADKINIEVIHFGLDKKLENSLEISVFRIIQELITNTIKHAEAKNASINISLYDKNLNIIIEDDGKGFNIKKINLKNGMGINSIKTRIAHLKGTFKVDSTINKGSSIIINIPIT